MQMHRNAFRALYLLIQGKHNKLHFILSDCFFLIMNGLFEIQKHLFHFN